MIHSFALILISYLHFVSSNYWEDPPFTLTPEAIDGYVTLNDETVSIPESFLASTSLLILNYNKSRYIMDLYKWVPIFL